MEAAWNGLIANAKYAIDTRVANLNKKIVDLGAPSKVFTHKHGEIEIERAGKYAG